MGCYEVSIGDTIGVGTAASVRRVYEVQRIVTLHSLLEILFRGQACLQQVSVEQLAAHMHDTYGQGLSNVLTSLQLGVRTIDASIAGLGGCPFATGASGNVATEDVLYLLDGLHIDHGIDWESVLDANRFITELVEVPNRSKAAAALMRRRMTSA